VTLPMFAHRGRPQCSWTGVSPDDLHAVACGKPAEGFVLDRTGRRVYACGEHIDRAREHAGGGRFIRGYHPEDLLPPLTHPAVPRQARQPAAVLGENT
jgi:hypothetical protein